MQEKQVSVNFPERREAEEPKSIKGTSKFLPRIIAVLCGLITALVLIEILFRIFEPRWHSNISRSDRPARFYVPKSYTDRPDITRAIPKPEGVFRILVLGDSFTYGQGIQVDDTFPARLERILNLNKIGKFEVLNWGVRGYSTGQELELLKKGLAKVGPDLVVLEITLNDPELQPFRVTHPGFDKSGNVQLNHWIFNHWRSLRFAAARVLNTLSHWRYNEYYFSLYDNQETWDRFNSSLASFASLAEAHKTPFFAVIFPLFSHTLDDSYPFGKLHEKLHISLNSHNFPFLDLLESYSHIALNRLQVEPGADSHPSEIAHRIAAEELYRELYRKKYLPKSARAPRLDRGR